MRDVFPVPAAETELDKEQISERNKQTIARTIEYSKRSITPLYKFGMRQQPLSCTRRGFEFLWRWGRL